MNERGVHTYQESVSQPDAWAEAVAVGSSAWGALQALGTRAARANCSFRLRLHLYLSLAAAAHARSAGLPARLPPRRDLALPESPRPPWRRAVLVRYALGRDLGDVARRRRLRRRRRA